MENELYSKKEFLDSVSGYSWSVYEKKRLGVDNIESLPVIKRLQLAVQFIESECNAKYGFLAQVATNTNLEGSTMAMPNVFDGALILGVLHGSGISLCPAVVNTIKHLLLANRSNDGVWNYLFRDYQLIPDDLETSSFAVCALQVCDISEAEVVKMSRQIFNAAKVYDDGLLDVYYPVKKLTGLADNCPLRKWSEARRVDMTVISNFLYLQNKVIGDCLPQLAACYQLLSDALDVFAGNDGDHSPILQYAKHYDNVDIICFFISRLVTVSNYARDLLKEKLAELIKGRLCMESNNPIALSCRILGGINVGLFDNKDTKELIFKEREALLKLQNEDNSYPKIGLFNAHKHYYFGSAAVSTAFAVAAIAKVENATL